MKSTLILTLLLLNIAAYANPIQEIEDCRGDASCVGKVLVRVIRNNGSHSNSGNAFRCKLEWKSTWGDPMPTLYGVGSTITEALERIESQCSGQPGRGNAQKCQSVYAGADCSRI